MNSGVKRSEILNNKERTELDKRRTSCVVVNTSFNFRFLTSNNFFAIEFYNKIIPEVWGWVGENQL